MLRVLQVPEARKGTHSKTLFLISSELQGINFFITTQTPGFSPRLQGLNYVSRKM